MNNKRNKISKKNEMNLINNTDNNTNNLDFQTYTMPFKSNIIKVNMMKNSNLNNNKNKKVFENNLNNNNINLKLNKNSKSYSNLKTSLKKKGNLYIKTDFKHNTINKFHSNSEKKIKLSIKKNLYEENDSQTQNNLKIHRNTLSKSSNNILNIKTYISGTNTRKKFKKKKSQNISTHFNIPKENLHINTNRSLDIKKPYLISSRVNTQRKKKDTKNKSLDLYNNDKKLIENKTITIPEYIIKLDSIKSRIYKLLNIYSLIALKSVSNSNNSHINNNDTNENNK